MQLKKLFSRLAPVMLGAALFTTPVVASSNYMEHYKAFKQAFEQENFAQALEHAEQALASAKSALGDNHATVLVLTDNYGAMLQANREYKKAIEVYYDLANAYQAQQDSSVARLEALLGVIDNGRRVALRDDAIETAHIRNAAIAAIDLLPELAEQDSAENVAAYYHAVVSAFGKMSRIPVRSVKFESILQQASELTEQAFGSEDPRTVEISFVKGLYQKGKSEYASAAESFEKIVAIVDDAYEYTHPWALTSRAHLVEIYENTDRSEAATKHCIAIGKMTPWDDNLEPTPLYRKPPNYPMNLARRGREGWVKLNFSITPNGFVEDISVIESDGGEPFEKAAKEALAQWRYAPKFVDGEAVTASQQNVQVDFKLM